MPLATRIRERMSALGITQAELARRVGVSQPAIHALVTRNKSGTRWLHRIAHELGTSPAYLAGEIDDPDANAPPPPAAPDVHHVMMAVALPPRRALVRMFDVLLEALPPEAGRDEQAGLLADWLPVALSQIRDLLPASPPAPAFPPLADALVDHESRS